MCESCGCGFDDDDDGHSHHYHHHDHGHDHDHGAPRQVKVEQDILSFNNGYAAANRDFFQRHSIEVLNLVSSPGSGKTTLLTRTLTEMQGARAVIEGDQTTDLDAARIRATGAPVVQINTGRGCHLDAHMVGHAMKDLELEKGALDGGVLFIENVGNLICPAAFDLGEAGKVALLSVTEGDDKPLKYPDVFRAAQLVLFTKSDLLPYVDFSIEKALANVRQINPDIQSISLSTKTGDGFQEWLAWLEKRRVE